MTAISAEESFSPIDNEPPLRWQRKLGLAPANGLGVMRRAMLLAGLTWLVPMIWAALNHRLWEGEPGESLLQHFGIHARLLLAVVLLVIAEATVHKGLTRIVRQFTESGIIGTAARAPFECVLQSMRRLGDITLPWVLLLGLVLAWTIADTPDAHTDALSWARDGNGQLGFGGWWVAYVSRPIFVALLLAWLWRLLLVVILFARIGRLDLALVPTHPDRAGGLDFVQALPWSFAPVSLALSAAISAHWAHDIVYHAVTLQALKLTAIAFVVISAFLWLLPLLMLAPALLAAKRQARLAYAALVGEQGAHGAPALDTARTGGRPDAARSRRDRAGRRYRSHLSRSGGHTPGADRPARDGCNHAANSAADVAGRRAANPAQGEYPEITQGACMNDDAYRNTPTFLIQML